MAAKRERQAPPKTTVSRGGEKAEAGGDLRLSIFSSAVFGAGEPKLCFRLKLCWLSAGALRRKSLRVQRTDRGGRSPASPVYDRVNTAGSPLLDITCICMQIFAA
jgi:hypothetical protein